MKKWLRHSLHRIYYTAARRNLDRTKENNTRKLTTACLPYVKGLAEKIQKICCTYDIRIIFTSGSTLWRYLFRLKLLTEFSMTKNFVYSIPCSCGKVYKRKTYRPLKVRLEEHRKGVIRGKIEKSEMANYIWKEKGNHLPLWDKVKIIDKEKHCWIKRLKESAHMLGYLLSRLCIEMNSMLEPINKKIRFQKIVTWTQQNIWHNGCTYFFFFRKLLNDSRLKVAGSILIAGE